MPQATLGDLVTHLRTICAVKQHRNLTDGELLQRFLVGREESAFSVLVRRHGPMVLGVCRRVLGDAHAAEDAFQATFMVLARRAASLGRYKLLGGWLYGVAQRIAVRARSQAATRQTRERQAAEMPREQPLDEPTWQELRAVLDEEIARLPEICRTPLVLCYFEGHSYAAAAQQLGWSKSTLAKRLNRAKELLRTQLSRRGLGLSSAALAAALTEKTVPVALGAVLTINTIKAGMRIATGHSLLTLGLSARAIALAEEGLKATFAISCKAVMAIMAISLTIGGVGLAGYAGVSDRIPGEVSKPEAKSKQSPLPKKQPANQPKQAQLPAADLYGDPLPPGAVARLGTVRWRHGQWVNALAFAPDGKMLASAGLGAYGLCLWEVSTGRPLQQLSVFWEPDSLAFSPDGKLIFVLGGISSHVCVIETVTGKEVRRLEGTAGAHLQRVAMSPDGKIIAAAENDGQIAIVIWEVATGKEIRRLEGHTQEVHSLAFAPDGRTLVSASDDKTLRVWDIETGKEARQLEPRGEAQLSVAFSPSSFLIASAGEGSLILIWDSKSGKLVRQLEGDTQGNSIAFSPDGRLLCFASWRGEIRIWDPSNGMEIRRWQASDGRILGVAFSPDGKTLASGGQWDHAIKLWDPSTGKEIHPLVGHSGVVNHLHFTPDGKTLFSSGLDFRVLEWDLSNNRERVTSNIAPIKKPGYRWGFDNVSDLSSDGKLLALVGSPIVEPNVKQGTVIQLWDNSTGKELQTLIGHEKNVWSVRFSRDGKLLASAAKEEDEIRLWDTQTGKALRRIPGNFVFEFSPDRRLLATHGDDKIVHLWDVATGKEIRKWDAQQHGLILVFSPDGNTLVTASKDRLLRLWEVATGKQIFATSLQETHSRTGTFRAVALSPSGRVIAVAEGRLGDLPNGNAEWTHAIHLFDAHSGELIRKIDAPKQVTYSLAFTPNGRLLAGGSADSTIVLWDVTGNREGGPVWPMTPDDFKTLWIDLASGAAKADKAIWALSDAPKESLPLLKLSLQLSKPADPQLVAKLISALDSTAYADRQNAAQALEKLGESAEAAVRKHLETNPPLEVRQRLQQFLESRSKDTLRKLRAIEVLEQIATLEARTLLQTLAKDSPNPRVAEAATAALAPHQIAEAMITLQ